jgi:hypothetical protein
MTHRRWLIACATGRMFVVAVLAVFGILSMPGDAAAQSQVGTLVGNVRDESGGAIPGATVTAREVRTNISRTAVSNEAGNYTFTNVASGVYRIEGELVGFKKFTRDNVEVSVNTTVRVDIALSVGALEESVIVTGEAPMLQTDRTDTGRVIQSEQITQMPLGFNRSYQGMLVTVPGASRPFRPHSEFYNAQDSLSSTVNGQNRERNAAKLEGTDNGDNLTFLIPSAEAIETVSVVTSNYDAEFGAVGGAVTNVTLKSGTNNLAGSLFSFGNTEATMSKNPFSLFPPNNTLYLQSGFTLGGPIRRNKLFFFGDYVHTLDDSGRISRAHIPEAAFRTGDFSAARTIIYDPATGSPNGTGRTPFPNNQIPANRISPVARRLLDKIPMPNVPGAPLGAINYEQPYVRSKTTNQFDIKMTYQAVASDNLAVRYSRQSSNSADPGTFGENGIWGGIKDYAGTGTQPSYNYSVNYNRVWSATLIQEIRTGQSYYRNIAITDANGMNLADQVGVPGANLTPFTSGAPTINIPAYHAFLIGTQNSLPWDRAKRTTNLATNVTKIWRNHTLKVGHEFRNTNDFLDQVTHPRGEFTFTGAMTAIPTDSAAQNGYANQMAAFLLDVPQEIERGIPAVIDVGLSMDEPHRGGRHRSFWTYVHDKWQVHPSITLDLGLRHEYYTPLVGFHGKGGMVNYDPETNELLVAGYGNIPENLGVPGYWKNFAPRTGISWRLTDATVLRAGYGVSGLAYPDGCCRGFPIEQNQLINGPNAFAPAGSMATGIPAPSLVPIPENGILKADGALLTQEFTNVTLEPRHRGQMHSWNVAYQRTLPGAFTAEMAYVGNRTSNPWGNTNINAGMVVGADRAGQPLFSKFGRTGSTTATVKDGRPQRKYHSMQVKVDRRMRGGLMMTNSYTLARGWDYRDDTPAHPDKFERNYGRSSFDNCCPTHNYTNSFVYMLPVGPEGKWLREGVASKVLGDWQVTGLFSASSGTPISFTASASGLRAPGNSQTPNVTETPKVLGGIGPNALWFDTSVFSAPPAGTWGNVKRFDLLTGPAYVNLDASIVKIVRFGPRHAELRADIFNALNRAHYANPNGTLGNANFGRVTDILPLTERMVRFGARFLF